MGSPGPSKGPPQEPPRTTNGPPKTHYHPQRPPKDTPEAPKGSPRTLPGSPWLVFRLVFYCFSCVSYKIVFQGSLSCPKDPRTTPRLQKARHGPHQDVQGLLQDPPRIPKRLPTRRSGPPRATQGAPPGAVRPPMARPMTPQGPPKTLPAPPKLMLLVVFCLYVFMMFLAKSPGKVLYHLCGSGTVCNIKSAI